MSACRLAITVPEFPKTCSSMSMNPSSRQRTSGKAAALASAWSTALSGNRAPAWISKPARVKAPALNCISRLSFRSNPKLPRTARRPGNKKSEPDATILLVEDNAAFRDVTRTILERLNFRVIDFGTAEEALAVIGDTTPIDLLLSDIGLPGDMDGHDLAQFAVSARPRIKIVLMSAHTDRAVSGSIIDSNVAAFLPKPHRKADLSRTLQRVLELDS